MSCFIIWVKTKPGTLAYLEFYYQLYYSYNYFKTFFFFFWSNAKPNIGTIVDKSEKHNSVNDCLFKSSNLPPNFPSTSPHH